MPDVTPVPPRDWSRWWWAYAAHWCTGFVAACGMLVAPVLAGHLAIVPFAMLPVLVSVRQIVEFLRRWDTPGRDLGDHLTGFVAGLFVGLLAVKVLERAA